MTHFNKPPANIPILTDILSEDHAPTPPARGEAQTRAWPPAEVVDLVDVWEEPARPAVDPQALTREVVGALRGVTEVALEARIRELLAPVLSNWADQLVIEVQQTVTEELQTVVAQAVEQALARSNQGNA